MGKKFTLGAALLFEEITGGSVTDMTKPKISDMLTMLYAQEHWDNDNRPTFEDFKKECSPLALEELTKRLNGPFSQPAVQ
jgi:hypothetical protein